MSQLLLPVKTLFSAKQDFALMADRAERILLSGSFA